MSLLIGILGLLLLVGLFFYGLREVSKLFPNGPWATIFIVLAVILAMIVVWALLGSYIGPLLPI